MNHEEKKLLRLRQEALLADNVKLAMEAIIIYEKYVNNQEEIKKLAEDINSNVNVHAIQNVYPINENVNLEIRATIPKYNFNPKQY